MNQSIGIKVVPFSVIDGKLKTFALGGHLPSKVWRRGMVLDAEVSHTITTSIGLSLQKGYIEQLYTVSRPEEKDFDIAIVYYFLVPTIHIKNYERWVDVNESPDRTLVEYALQRLRWKIEYTNVAYALLPDEFVFGDLQKVYEAILGRSIDKRNFRKKIFSLNILKDSGKKRTLGRARPAEVYTFKERKLSIVEIL